MFVETDEVVMHRDPQGPALGSHALLIGKMVALRQAERRQQQIDLIVDKIRYGAVGLYSDYIEEAHETADMVKAILFDREDDKLGRITDLYDQTLTSFATWLVDSGNTSATITKKRKLGVL